MRAHLWLLLFLSSTGCGAHIGADAPTMLDEVSNEGGTPPDTNQPESELTPPTLDDALAGSPLVMELQDRHEGGCSQTMVSTRYEGPFSVTLNDDQTGEAQLTIEHRDTSRSWVDRRGPIGYISHKRFTWSVEHRRGPAEITLELTPAPGCELVNDTPANTLFGCPPETPPVVLVCGARRMGEVDLSTVEPLEGLSSDVTVLLCRSAPSNQLSLIGALWFMREPFVLAPAPGVRVTHARGDNLIEGELIRPEE